jgi:hypothetical protein
LEWDENQGAYVRTYTGNYQECNDLRENLENVYGIGIDWYGWTLADMNTLADSIYAVDRALSTIGIAWSVTPLDKYTFKKGSPGGGKTFGRTISISDVSFKTITHEMGHAIDSNRLGTVELHDLFDENSGNCGIMFCNRTASEDYAYRKYGATANNTDWGVLGGAYGLLARQGETWADAFSAWVYHNKDSSGSNPSAWVDTKNYNPSWSNIYTAVEDALTVKFGD